MQPEGDRRDAQVQGQLLSALDAAQTRGDQLDQALFVMTEAVARQVMYAVDRWCDIAGNPRDPRQLNARKLLQGWVATMDRARQLVSGVQPARTMPGGPNGSA